MEPHPQNKKAIPVSFKISASSPVTFIWEPPPPPGMPPSFQIVIQFQTTKPWLNVFPALFYTSAREIPTHFYTSSLTKVPLSGEPPRIVHYREYPPPPGSLTLTAQFVRRGVLPYKSDGCGRRTFKGLKIRFWYFLGCAVSKRLQLYLLWYI